jgi:hypothetical protein
MLNDRRNCFLGRNIGFEVRLLWLPIGEPFRNDDMLPKGLLTRGNPISADAEGLLADCGLRSCTGDSPKHSSSDIDVDVHSLLDPIPNLKGGNWPSALQGPRALEPRLLVVNPFVRASDGRTKIDFRRLVELVYDEPWNVQSSLLNARSWSLHRTRWG